MSRYQLASSRASRRQPAALEGHLPRLLQAEEVLLDPGPLLPVLVCSILEGSDLEFISSLVYLFFSTRVTACV